MDQFHIAEALSVLTQKELMQHSSRSALQCLEAEAEVQVLKRLAFYTTGLAYTYGDADDTRIADSGTPGWLLPICKLDTGTNGYLQVVIP